jgi:hypothetical protein
MSNNKDEMVIKIDEDRVSTIITAILQTIHNKGWNTTDHALEVYAALKMMSDQMGEEMGVVELNQEPDEKPQRIH